MATSMKAFFTHLAGLAVICVIYSHHIQAERINEALTFKMLSMIQLLQRTLSLEKSYGSFLQG